MTSQPVAYEAEIERLKKINAALITRIEAGAAGGAAYDSFAHSVFLADQVRERTAALNDAMQQLTQSNRELEQAKAEAEKAQILAEQAKASQTRLLTAISHDIMQPVCAAQLLVANLQENATLVKTKKIGAISQAVGDIEYLLQSLLDYARQGKEQQLNLQPQSVDDILAGLAIEALPQAQVKGLDFVYRPTHAWVETDGNVLTRILRNLISNALRYTHEGEVSLAVVADDDQIKITIKDTGCGFVEAYPGELLEPFKKAANNGNNDGLGLGLSNVASLCASLGHELAYASQTGIGSQFVITLPRISEQKPKTIKANPSGTLPFPYRVLVVDNSPAVNEALAGLLESWGASSYCVADLSEATQTLLAGIDVVILDYHLDYQRTGLQLLQEREVTCPVLFITASNDEADLQRISAAGYPVVKKPIKPARLRRALEDLLSD